MHEFRFNTAMQTRIFTEVLRGIKAKFGMDLDQRTGESVIYLFPDNPDNIVCIAKEADTDIRHASDISVPRLIMKSTDKISVTLKKKSWENIIESIYHKDTLNHPILNFWIAIQKIERQIKEVL